EQPDGPLVVYRAVGGDLRHVVPVVTVPRGPVVQTPVLFPSLDVRYVALLNPLMMRYASNLNGATLSVLSTDGRPFAPVESRRPLLNTGGSPASARTLALHVASAGQVIWSSDSRYLYYQSGASSQPLPVVRAGQTRSQLDLSSYDEIHR